MYLNNPNYEQQKKLLEIEYQKILQDQIEYSKQFVTNNPFSMASIIALFQKFDDQNFIINDLQTMRTAASALNSIYPQSEHVKVLYAHTLEYLKNQSNANARQLIQEHGENSPDITLPDTKGNLISLSSLRGKVVLLQFWASVDQGSRTMNPVLVEAYKKYKSKGFEIYQVSLDNNRIEWVDAIDQDELGWINVGDMEGSTLAVSHYNIQAIPYNYLLNTDGTIIAQNLNGPALDRTLSHILK
jgi:thiol-disulfide isomerase/thioredoxin